MTNNDGDDGLLVQPDLPILDPPQRVSGMRVPDGWTLPGKSEGLSTDAVRALDVQPEQWRVEHRSAG